MGARCEADLARRHEAASSRIAAEEVVGGFRRRVEFLPGYDHRTLDCGNGSPGANHGQHGMTMTWVLIGEHGATQWVVYLMHWVPGTTDKIGDIRSWSHSCAMAADLGYHAREPRYEGQYTRDDCDILGGRCYYDGSGLRAEPILAAFIERGPAAVWGALEAEYRDLFDATCPNCGHPAHPDSPSCLIAEDRRSDAREAMADVVEQAAAMDGEP